MNILFITGIEAKDVDAVQRLTDLFSKIDVPVVNIQGRDVTEELRRKKTFEEKKEARRAYSRKWYAEHKSKEAPKCELKPIFQDDETPKAEEKLIETVIHPMFCSSEYCYYHDHPIIDTDLIVTINDDIFCTAECLEELSNNGH